MEDNKSTIFNVINTIIYFVLSLIRGTINLAIKQIKEGGL